MISKTQQISKTPSRIIPDIFRLKSYYYHLPEKLIAQKPCLQRDKARLLIIDRSQGTIRHDTFDRLNNYLPADSHLVINNSKVIAARLLGNRSTGGKVEVFLLNPMDDGYSFEVLLKPLKKIKEKEELKFGSGVAAILEDKDKRIVRFNKKNIIKYLNKVGHIPLPPYIKRPDTSHDRQDYQTVYAKQPGSVASPTAGLHFTNELIKELKKEGHHFSPLTLHINYGTFKPVECDDIRLHPMHEEYYTIKPSVYKTILKAKNRSKIVAVGTTSARVLETIATNHQCRSKTNIFIHPGSSFKMVDALITNFHLPYSTLLMLVCAFGGYDLVMKAYKEAIDQQYRFYSYGDAMLIV